MDKSAMDICYATGRYTDECDCSICPNKYECSGSPEDEDECEED